MSKFEEILLKYSDIMEQITPEVNIDLGSLDKATGEQIKSGLLEVLGNDENKANEVLQGIINSKSINPNPQVAATTQTQQATTAKVANQTSTPQTNPITSAERTAVSQPTP